MPSTLCVGRWKSTWPPADSSSAPPLHPKSSGQLGAVVWRLEFLCRAQKRWDEFGVFWRALTNLRYLELVFLFIKVTFSLLYSCFLRFVIFLRPSVKRRVSSSRLSWPSKSARNLVATSVKRFWCAKPAECSSKLWQNLLFSFLCWN